MWDVKLNNLSVKAFSRNWDSLILRGVHDVMEFIFIRYALEKPKLSVVVPLYNSELFMCRTIDSILASTFPNLELILIDDGSTDKSYEIAQWYEENFTCVRAYTQENKWVCETRNRWLELANWEFMAFCDNDDIIHPCMYDILYDAWIKDTDIDIAIA